MIIAAEGDGLPSLINALTRRTKLFGLVASLLLVMGACDEAITAPNDLQGTWQSRGYGLVAEAGPDDVRLIERTPVSCLSSGVYSMDEFLSRFNITRSREERTFKILDDGTLSAITFDALDPGAFDRLCPKGLTPRTDDPELNFEVMWHTFDQHYAFFAQRNVDWDAVYAEFRPRISKETTKKELGNTLKEILQRLGDAHVSLQIGRDSVVWVDSRLAERILQRCRKRWGSKCDFDAYLEKLEYAFEKTLRSKYLEDGFETALDGDVMWGKIGETTGYFRIDSMEGLGRGSRSSRDDLAALEPVLDDMLEDIGHLPSMIVDVRLNGGGHDAVALAVASRFADARRVFGTKQAFNNGHPTQRQDLIVKPAERPRYRGRVAVLTSSETASAAEVFVLAMRSMPHVTLVGEATTGIFSDELYRSLPNGWSFSLSNEIYLTPKGESFEGTGVPPNVVAPFLSAEDDEDDVDSIIDAAMATLRQGNRP